ncbi:uncharacterized protein O3C94_018715 isoform 1-T1 [Discoglossus pictus]
MSPSSMDEIKSKILKFSLADCEHGNQGYNRVLLQLFGLIGHGKSSLVNSCKFVLEDKEYEMYAGAVGSHVTVTLHRTAYPLTNTITIVDNRGCSSMDTYETAEVYAQLGNFLPLNEEVVWPEGFVGMMRTLENSVMDPNYSDLIVPVFVYSVRSGAPNESKEHIKGFLRNCKDMTGIFPIIVLTHKTSGDFYEVEKTFRLMGAEQVIKLENYTAEDHLPTLGKHSDVLNFLSDTLENVNFQMKKVRNPKQEMIKHKIFVLKFIHDGEIAKKMEESEKEKNTSEKAKTSMRGKFKLLDVASNGVKFFFLFNLLFLIFNIGTKMNTRDHSDYCDSETF